MVDEEDNADGYENHQPNGQLGESESVTAFEALGEPMDHHAEQKDDENGGIVAEDGGNLFEIPVASDFFDHLAGGLPGLLVGFSGVEVGPATEKESGERDEDEGE